VGLTFKNRNNIKQPMPRKTKTKVSLTIDSGLIEWIDKQIEEFVFQSRSHAVEQAIFKLKKDMESAIK
jgi:Arc/MetJ-type ribon-helix-helix transcriptional regulator